MIEIKTTFTLMKEILDFLIPESFALFLKLKGYSSISEEQKITMKETLKQMYLENTSENQMIFVAYINNQIVGCACISGNYINDLFIKKEYQKKGIGSILLKEIIAYFGDNKLTFDTYFENVDYFKRLGFKVIEENEDSIKMQR